MAPTTLLEETAAVLKRAGEASPQEREAITKVVAAWLGLMRLQQEIQHQYISPVAVTLSLVVDGPQEDTGTQDTRKAG